MKRPPLPGRLATSLLDLLFPPRCVGCGREGSYLCPACLETTPRLTSSIPGEGLEGIAAPFAMEGPAREAVHRLVVPRPLSVETATAREERDRLGAGSLAGHIAQRGVERHHVRRFNPVSELTTAAVDVHQIALGEVAQAPEHRRRARQL